MRIDNNTLIADSGKYLKTKYNPELVSQIELGARYMFINGSTRLVNISQADVEEVRPVTINSETLYIASVTYKDIVSELIRSKYSLDDELALIANMRLGNTKGEEEFQNWRKTCKEIAKSLTNE